MRSSLALLWILSISTTVHAGVGETKAQIRDRYGNIIFSARETIEAGPVHEEYDYRGRKVEVHYENHLSATEVFHGIKSLTEAQRILSATQVSDEWRVSKKDEKEVLWRSGPLEARLEKETLRVSTMKKESAR